MYNVINMCKIFNFLSIEDTIKFLLNENNFISINFKNKLNKFIEIFENKIDNTFYYLFVEKKDNQTLAGIEIFEINENNILKYNFKSYGKNKDLINSIYSNLIN